MTIQGAIAELQNLLEADDVPFYYKGGIEKVIETIQMEMADRKTEPQKKEVEWGYNKRERLWYPYSNGELLFKDEPNSSENPNNCEYAKNPSGDVWECGCFLDTYCEHQIYDRNPDGTINIVECGYEPKDEATISKMEQVDKDINVRSKEGE